MKKKLNWLNNRFICKELYAPFELNDESIYIGDLDKKYKIMIEKAKELGADNESIEIIERYSNSVLEAIKNYTHANVENCYKIILELINDVSKDEYALSSLNNSYAFKGIRNDELQLFRARIGKPSDNYTIKDMLHLPNSERFKAGNYRFSIPGNPSFYLANSSYGCWIECGFPSDSEFYVAPVLLEGNLKIFNLAVMIREFVDLNEFECSRVHTWLKLLVLMIATSYVIKKENRVFKIEYVISQSIMIACKKLGYSGVAYYSTRVKDTVFARCAVNLALFVDYEDEYSELVYKYLKMNKPFNYSIYMKLNPLLRKVEYKLRIDKVGCNVNVGDYDNQFEYRNTEFYLFDKFLFSQWEKGKGKDELPFGIKVSD